MRPRSVRFDDEVLRRLDRYVRSHPGTSASSVTNLFVDEALRAEVDERIAANREAAEEAEAAWRAEQDILRSEGRAS